MRGYGAITTTVALGSLRLLGMPWEHLMLVGSFAAGGYIMAWFDALDWFESPPE